MQKVLRLKDRVSIKLGDLTLKLAPLSFQQQMEINSCTRKVNGEDIADDASKVLLMVRYSLKDIEGLELYDGKPYKLELDDEGNLTSEQAGEIMNMPVREDIIIAAGHIMANNIDAIPGEDVKVELGN